MFFSSELFLIENVRFEFSTSFLESHGFCWKGFSFIKLLKMVSRFCSGIRFYKGTTLNR